jgi:hypothetical protein
MVCCGDPDAVDEENIILCCGVCCAHCGIYNDCDCPGCSGKIGYVHRAAHKTVPLPLLLGTDLSLISLSPITFLYNKIPFVLDAAV